MSTDPFNNEPEPPHAETLDTVAARAVELGYKVIEEQIQIGQRMAEQLNDGKIDAAEIKGSVSEVVERLRHFYSDLGALWFEMLESVFRNPSLGEWLSNMAPDGHRSGSATANPPGMRPAAPGNPVNMPVEIVSVEPTGARVIIEMHAHTGTATLVAEPLRSRLAENAPLTQVEFVKFGTDWPLTLRVTIPAGQNPGSYSGLILNSLTDEPAGTLCVQIPDQAAGVQG